MVGRLVRTIATAVLVGWLCVVWRFWDDFDGDFDDGARSSGPEKPEAR